MPLSSYELNPFLNKKKLFQCTPPSSIDYKSLPSLPPKWLAELEDFCRKETSNLNKGCFDRHLPIIVTASNRSLLDGLQLIYRRLRGEFSPLSESDRTATILKLIEGVYACTEGFENRVKHIITSFELPENLAELLYQVRKGLVESVSITLTNEIHAWNWVTKVAEAEGLGVKANFAQDPYNRGLPKEKVVLALEKEFKEKYVPFNLAILLTEQLPGLLARIDYTGPKQDGYAVGVAERIAEQIKCYLAIETVTRMDWKDFFIINENDDFNIVIHDLNWELIRKCFFQILSEQEYFTEQPSQKVIDNLLDCARFSHLFSTDAHLLGIESACFNENSIFQLKKIKTDFPVFWQRLRLGFQHNSDLREKIPLLLSELEAAPLSVSTLEKIDLLFELDLISLINDGSALNISAKLIQKKIHDWNEPMLVARSHPEGLKFILEFVDKNPTLLDKATLQKMFLQIDNQGWNALMSVARYHPEGLKFILKFIAHYELCDEKILKQVMAKNTAQGWNLFIIKALLEKYLEGISDRKAQGITYTTKFFQYNFGYSTQEKEVAALKLREILETGLEESEPIKNLIDLKQSYPALSNGRLGQLCDLCCKIASDATALAEVKNIIKESREECSMISRQNP